MIHDELGLFPHLGGEIELHCSGVGDIGINALNLIMVGHNIYFIT